MTRGLHEPASIVKSSDLCISNWHIVLEPGVGYFSNQRSDSIIAVYKTDQRRSLVNQ